MRSSWLVVLAALAASGCDSFTITVVDHTGARVEGADVFCAKWSDGAPWDTELLRGDVAEEGDGRYSCDPPASDSALLLTVGDDVGYVAFSGIAEDDTTVVLWRPEIDIGAQADGSLVVSWTPAAPSPQVDPAWPITEHRLDVTSANGFAVLSSSRGDAATTSAVVPPEAFEDFDAYIQLRAVHDFPSGAPRGEHGVYRTAHEHEPLVPASRGATCSVPGLDEPVELEPCPLTDGLLDAFSCACSFGDAATIDLGSPTLVAHLFVRRQDLDEDPAPVSSSIDGVDFAPLALPLTAPVEMRYVRVEQASYAVEVSAFTAN